MALCRLLTLIASLHLALLLQFALLVTFAFYLFSLCAEGGLSRCSRWLILIVRRYWRGALPLASLILVELIISSFVCVYVSCEIPLASF